jgi:outer membrane lipoprotein-sorting protein
VNRNLPSSLFGRLAAVLLVLSTLPASLAFAGKKPKASHDLSEILDRMNDSAKRLKTVSADLEYTKVTVLVNDRSTESGRLYYRNSKNPEILISIEKPENKVILFKKSKAQIYLPKINQIQEYSLEQRSELVQQFFLLGFGSETGDLKKAYNIMLLREEELEGDSTAVLELVPRKQNVAAQLVKIEIWISEESWLPVQQKFYEPGGDYLIARYTGVKVNRSIPSRTFEIRAKDAKRVKMN